MAQGNASGENVMGQKMMDGGGNKKNQGHDDMVEKKSCVTGGCPMPESETSYCNTPKGQKVV